MLNNVTAPPAGCDSRSTRRSLEISTSSHKVHGLDGALVAPDWAALTLSEVNELLDGYDCVGSATQLLSTSPRPFSAASRVATGSGELFVKRHARSVRTQATLEEEHRFLIHLAKRTPLVRAPYAARDGHTAIMIGNWTYEVHPCADGLDRYEDALSWTPYFSVEHAQAAGSALAELHKAAKNFNGPSRKQAPLLSGFSLIASLDPVATFRQFLAARPPLEAWLGGKKSAPAFERMFLPWHRRLQPCREALAPLWTHNDWHGSNLIWSDDDATAQATAVIDFGLADKTCAVHDLATAIERSAIEWLRLDARENIPVHLDQVVALLQGYQERLRLTSIQRHALAAMLPIVHCEFALSEADYFLTVLEDEERAEIAWEGYFLGHLRWFDSPEGRAVLHFLESWAADEPAPRKEIP